MFAPETVDCCLDIVLPWRSAAARPVGQVDILILSKSHRRLGLIQANRNEPPAVPTSGRFVPYPRGCNRCLRPQYNDCIRSLQRILYLPAIFGPAPDVEIPPDSVATLFQRMRYRTRFFAVIASIAQEHAGQEQPPNG